MKEILRVLRTGCDVTIGTRATLFAYSDGTVLGIHLDNSLSGPQVKPTVPGLRALFRWLDQESAGTGWQRPRH